MPSSTWATSESNFMWRLHARSGLGVRPSPSCPTKSSKTWVQYLRTKSTSCSGMRRWRHTARASARSWLAVQVPSPCSSASSQLRMNIPSTWCPALWRRSAATAESTPPEMPTTTLCLPHGRSSAPGVVAMPLRPAGGTGRRRRAARATPSSALRIILPPAAVPCLRRSRALRPLALLCLRKSYASFFWAPPPSFSAAGTGALLAPPSPPPSAASSAPNSSLRCVAGSTVPVLATNQLTPPMSPTAMKTRGRVRGMAMGAS
mmetsp:Transcript_19037/g.61080  ORF Transcript_19037/g.61080 Transcript_19037/m.61080 type:complete len:261 (-) Transcript_19037:367-1149(-)